MKSDGAKSGVYGGCSKTFQPSCLNFSCLILAIYDLTLSCLSLSFSVDQNLVFYQQFFVHFIQYLITHVCCLHSLTIHTIIPFFKHMYGFGVDMSGWLGGSHWLVRLMLLYSVHWSSSVKIFLKNGSLRCLHCREVHAVVPYVSLAILPCRYTLQISWRCVCTVDQEAICYFLHTEFRISFN